MGKTARSLVSFLSGDGDHGVRLVHGAAMDFVAVAVSVLFGGRLFLHPGDWVLLFAVDEQCAVRVAADIVLQLAAAVRIYAGILFRYWAAEYSGSCFCDSNSGRGCRDLSVI